MAADIVDSGHGLFFVESGGLGTTVGGRLVAQVCAGGDLLSVHEDKDLTVYTPAVANGTPDASFLAPVTVHGEYFYSCCIPSLHNIRDALEDHDATHGPSTVLFDGAHALRPYWHVVEDFDDSPRLRLTPAQSDGWRATDLWAFAGSRTTPTIAVWDYPNELPSGLAALLAVSLMHVTVEWPIGAPMVEVTVARRRHLTEPWGPARVLQVQEYAGPPPDGFTTP